LAQKVAHPNRDLARQHRLAILRHKNQMHLQVALRVRSQSVMSRATTLHQILLRLKARGFRHPDGDTKQPHSECRLLISMIGCVSRFHRRKQRARNILTSKIAAGQSERKSACRLKLTRGGRCGSRKRKPDARSRPVSPSFFRPSSASPAPHGVEYLHGCEPGVLKAFV
jgi:hypothetical protein